MARQFNIVPTDEELASLDRDLRFHPTNNNDPKSLTLEQIEQYNRNGFLAPLNVYDRRQITEIREYFDELLDRVSKQGGNSYSISSAHLKYGPVYDILTNSTLVDYVSDLLGENVVAWGAHFFCKMPGDGKAVAWHQDASYWPLSPSKALTVWLAVDDSDEENACVKFVSGSHYFGHLTYRPSKPEDHNVLNQTIDSPEQYGRIVLDCLEAGQASIHSDLLLHGSEANNSTRRRCGLTLRYCSAEVKAALGWNEKGVIVRGVDQSRHWHNNMRPSVE